MDSTIKALEKKDILFALDNLVKPEDDIVSFSREFARFLHKGILRLDGKPYFSHLEEVKETVSGIIYDSEYRNAAISGSWLHDAPEDIKVIDVFNPYDPIRQSERKNNFVYLNDILENCHDEGEYVCYLVDGMTNREKIYFEYMEKKFKLSEEKVRHDLDVISLIKKMADRNSNSKSGEILDMDIPVKRYMDLHQKSAGEEEFMKFYDDYKVLSHFMKAGEYGYNLGLFTIALTQRFEEKHIANALDNLNFYIPKAESILLLPYHETPHRLFDYHKLRGLLKNTFSESLTILESKIPNYFNVLRKTGYHRGNEDILGYTTLREEIEKERILCSQLK